MGFGWFGSVSLRGPRYLFWVFIVGVAAIIMVLLPATPFLQQII